MSVSWLPQEILEKMFVFLGEDPKAIGACARVCHEYKKAADSQYVWSELACLKYGQPLAHQTVGLYDGNYKSMMIDDNKRGAIPSIAMDPPLACNWRSNRVPNRFYCCLITDVKWFRQLGEIHVYIDVRGEVDLRPPSTSSIAKLLSPNTIPQAFSLPLSPHRVVSAREQEDVLVEDPRQLLQMEGERWAQMLRHRLYRNYEGPGGGGQHFKGCLMFRDNYFQDPGIYHFCYANRQHSRADYQSVELFVVPPTGGLEEVFRKGQKMAYQSIDSPFKDDTPQLERARWDQSIPPQMMMRRDWYV